LTEPSPSQSLAGSAQISLITICASLPEDRQTAILIQTAMKTKKRNSFLIVILLPSSPGTHSVHLWVRRRTSPLTRASLSRAVALCHKKIAGADSSRRTGE
jgi:hypothetical protein